MDPHKQLTRGVGSDFSTSGQGHSACSDRRASRYDYAPDRTRKGGHSIASFLTTLLFACWKRYRTYPCSLSVKPSLSLAVQTATSCTCATMSTSTTTNAGEQQTRHDAVSDLMNAQMSPKRAIGNISLHERIALQSRRELEDILEVE